MIEENNAENSTMRQGDEGEVSLLDMLVLVARNIKLLILGPLAAGLLALGVCYLVPQSYTSEAILALPNISVNGTVNQAATATATAQAAAIMVSPIVLDPVIASLNLAEGHPIQVARKKLVNQVKAVAGKDGLLRLDATADTPVAAQNIANAVISAWLKSSLPGAEEQADLEKRFESAKSSLDAVDRLLKRLTTEGSSTLSQPLTRGEAGTSIVAISELQAKFLGEVLSIPRTLKGYSHDVVKQAPTLPTETVAPKKAVIAVLVTLMSGLLTLLGLFFSGVWRSVSRDPVAAKKQAALLSAIGFKA
jgi:Chain length determinant protein